MVTIHSFQSYLVHCPTRASATRASVLLTSLLVLFSACGDKKPETTTKTRKGPLVVYTVNEPLRYFAERLGGDAVRVVFPMKVAGDPAFWHPDADTVMAYQKADLILRNGADYAKWIGKVSLPESKIVDTSAAFADRIITIKNAVTHQHGPNGKHSHSGHVGTTWLDPLQARLQAKAIEEALQERLPDQSAAIEKRFESLSQELEDLDKKIQKIVDRKPGLPLIASHPVYQYLQRRYGLSLQTVHWEPSEMPPAEEWTKFEAMLAKHPAKYMIWESEPLPAVRQKLMAMGVQALVYDPCGSTPKDGDFMSRMRKNVDSLAQAWR